MIIKLTGDDANAFTASMMIEDAKTLKEALRGIADPSPMADAIRKAWKSRGD